MSPASPPGFDGWTVKVWPHFAIPGMFDVFQVNPFYGGWECVGTYGSFEHAATTAAGLRCTA